MTKTAIVLDTSIKHHIILAVFAGTLSQSPSSRNIMTNGNPIVEDLHYNQTMIEGYEYDLSQFIALDYFTNNGIAASAIKSVEIIKSV